MHHAGKDRDDLDRRQMGEPGRDQKQVELLFRDLRLQPLEGLELAVELQHRHGDGRIGIIAEQPARDAARNRRYRCDKGVAIGPLAPGNRHRHEQNVRRHEKYRAFDEGDNGEPHFGSLAAGKREGPGIEFS